MGNTSSAAVTSFIPSPSTRPRRSSPKRQNHIRKHSFSPGLGAPEPDIYTSICEPGEKCSDYTGRTVAAVYDRRYFVHFKKKPALTERRYSRIQPLERVFHSLAATREKVLDLVKNLRAFCTQIYLAESRMRRIILFLS